MSVLCFLTTEPPGESGPPIVCSHGDGGLPPHPPGWFLHGVGSLVIPADVTPHVPGQPSAGRDVHFCRGFREEERALSCYNLLTTHSTHNGIQGQKGKRKVLSNARVTSSGPMDAPWRHFNEQLPESRILKRFLTAPGGPWRLSLHRLTGSEGWQTPAADAVPLAVKQGGP